MNFFNEIAGLDFLRNALIASFLMSITCAIVGTYIVVRRLVFLSGGITHASFGGIGIAYYLGINPLLGALIFSILSVLGFDVLARKGNLREDSAIGVLWSMGMAVGILFIFMTPGYAPNLMSFLFGNILTVTTDLLLFNGLLAVGLLLGFFVFHRVLMNVAFDRDFSRTQNIPTTIVESIMLVVIAITIVLTIKLVGIMLLVSLLTIPPITVSCFCKTYKTITLYSILFTFIGSFLGLMLSFMYDIPSGPAIILVMSIIYIIVKLVTTITNKRPR